jgi:hypothetical protein
MTANAPNDQLKVIFSRVAAVASLTASILACAACAAFIVLDPDAPGQTLGLLGAGVAASLATAVFSWKLLRLRPWAMLWVLGTWSSVAAAALVVLISSMASGEAISMSGAPLPAELIIGGIGAIAVFLCVLTVQASAAMGRGRYGAYATIATVAALAVVVVLNVIAQQDDMHYRVDLQALGRYSISERTRGILAAAPKADITVTVMYNSEAKDGDERRARVMDLLSEMREAHGRLSIQDASSDAKRAGVIARLVQQAAQQAPDHLELLADFTSKCDSAVKRLEEVQQQWRQLAGKSYMDNWGLAAFGERYLKDAAEGLENAQAQIRREMSEFPNYAKLSADAQQAAQDAVQRIEGLHEGMNKIRPLPEAIAANKQKAFAELDAAFEAIGAAATSLGPPNKTVENPTAVLTEFIKAVEAAANQMEKTAARIDEIAGASNADIIRGSRAWRLGQMQQGQAVINDPRSTISMVYASLARELREQKASVESLTKAATTEYQASVVNEMRKAFIALLRDTGELNQTVRDAVEKLSTVDAPTMELLEQAKEKYLADVVEPLTEIASKQLKPVENSTIAQEIRGDDIILIEVEGKIGVVGFEDVWPQRARLGGPAVGLEGADDRAFNGDSAIGSKILSMTQPPFARVLFTYAKTPELQQLEQQIMQERMMGRNTEPPPFLPSAFGELQRRMEQANLQVSQWDLASGETPEGIESAVLLVLPPPPPMQANPYAPPQQTPYEPYIEMVNKAIDAGATAIFMTQYDWASGMGGGYPYNDYLRSAWGVNVRTDCLVIPVQRSSDEAQERYFLAPLRLRHLPLSTFSDHPIASPLQGQRVLWQLLCPIQAAAAPEGVAPATSLLGVPSDEMGIWAIADVQRIGRQIESNVGSSIRADTALGDILPPFDVAVAVTREGREDRKPSRIVVLTMAAGLTDGYLTDRVSVIRPDSGLTTYEPPRVNPDVVINSAYWLAGRQDHIASGPVQIQPMRTIDPLHRKWLWAICVIALPLAVLAGGGVLLYIRRF